MCRENDKSIMQYFHELGNKGKRLQTLNKCRLYMRINVIAGIVSMDSNKIRQEAKDLTRGGDFRLRRSGLTKKTNPK